MFDYALFKQILNKKKAYKCYQKDSFIKDELATRLIDKLTFLNIKPRLIYLEGPLNQTHQKMLLSLYPSAKITTVLNEAVDLIISNATLHLAHNIYECIETYQQFLAPDGVLLFSTFGSLTLQEVKKAWEEIDSSPHINAMLDMHDIGDILLKSNLINPVMDSEVLTLTYDSLAVLFQDIRELQEPLSDTKMSKGLMGKQRWQAFCDELQNLGLSMSYEFVYGYAYQSTAALGKPKEDEVCIDLMAIKRMLNGSNKQ